MPGQEGTGPAAASSGAGVGNTRSPGPVNWRSEEGGERFLLPVGVSVLGCCAGIKMIPKETGASAGK